MKRSILFVAVLTTLLSASAAFAGERSIPDGFVVLLSGPYRPVVQGPDLGLSQVNLSDGSFSRTRIYGVTAFPGEGKSSNHADGCDSDTIGTFYVQFAGSFAAYDLPGGAMTMVFTENNLKAVPDGQGGTYYVGDLRLNIVEGTGIYKSFAGGHNHMVDVLHMLADGSFVEHCYCIITRT